MPLFFPIAKVIFFSNTKKLVLSISISHFLFLLLPNVGRETKMLLSRSYFLLLSISLFFYSFVAKVNAVP